MQLTPEHNATLLAWQQADQMQREWREKEIAARGIVVNMFADAAKESGTETIDLVQGYKLKIEKKLNYSLDKEKVDAALAHFDETMQEVLVKWSPSLSVSIYKELGPEQQAHFNNCLTIKPGLPTIEIVAPKVKK